MLAKELADKGDNIEHYTIEQHTDIHDLGYLAYYFSKGNDNFNEDFKKGMVKIATEYAIHCGIDREVLTEVISIDDKGKGTIDYDKAKLTPFRGCKLKCVKKSKKIITLDTLFLL